MSDTAQWSDLGTRILSGLVLLIVGVGALWIGGPVFNAVISLACAAMVWELATMIAPDKRGLAIQVAVLTGAAVFAAAYLPGVTVYPVLIAPALVGATQIPQRKMAYFIWAAIIAIAGYEMVFGRGFSGLIWVSWLIVIVVAADVAGYFAGKAIGGPKLWPQVSPNKTWSGTIAGWIAAAGVGIAYASYMGMGGGLVAVSVLVAMASQVGDVAESALKRRVGVKDASSLIPGHGGVFDRFDGMIGAVLCIKAIVIALNFYASLAS